MKKIINLILFSVFIIGGGGIVNGATYPIKPVRMLVPSPPGGGTDTLARIVRENLQQDWPQPVIVENRGGASGRIAALAVAKATADGYTLLFTYGGVITTGLPLFGQLAYDPIKDFSAISMVAHVPNFLVSHPSFKLQNINEIIKTAKAKPGSLTHGTSSIGSSSHLSMVLFKQMTGIKMLQVSYPGDGPASIALISGEVPFAFLNSVVAAPHIISGRLRAIAVSAPQRMNNFGDIPTIQESGLKGFNALLFYCVMAPAKTPQAIIRQLHDTINEIIHRNAVLEQFARLGAVAYPMTIEELRSYLQIDLDQWKRVIKNEGIVPEA